MVTIMIFTKADGVDKLILNEGIFELKFRLLSICAGCN